jgi:hypothetical protein
MQKAEGNLKMQEIFSTRMEAKKEQVDIVKEELHYFKNETFRNRVAELLQWSIIHLGFCFI